jgi:arylsulfatase A-like enzyme
MLTRRGFTAALGAGAVAAAPGARPNILWLTCEDIGPQLGCYGDAYATTPNIDKLAARGMRYQYAWSNAPVCAPARTTIISGLYPPSTGSEHMRSMTSLAPNMKMYPSLLREAGYYTSNNAKEDYNIEHTGDTWHESNARAHWRQRAPGQPFMSVFNFLGTHESQVRKRPHKWIHDPAAVRVPAYHPDTIEVRQDWAQYYDNITEMDAWAGKHLADLQADGLADDTIVFFYGDHGAGMPRSKRWPYNSGLHVGIVVYVPEKWRHLAPREYKPGGTSDRMAAFVDLAPTVCSIAGVKPPEYMQGSALMGRYPGVERQYNYGFRGRMDERYDLVRSVRDRRYVYIRNYMPHKIYGQYIQFMFQTPTTTVWKKLYDEGKLKPPRTYFWETKPPEELYDLENDRDEVNNLVHSPAHQDVLKRMRAAQQEWTKGICDVGLLPEGEIHSRAQGSTPYQAGHDAKKYPVARVLDTANLASGLAKSATPDLVKRLADVDSGVRYWAAMGLLMRGKDGVAAAHDALVKALQDASPHVRVVAAEALGRYGSDADAGTALDALVALAPADRNGAFVSLLALNALDAMGKRAAPAKQAISGMTVVDGKVHKRFGEYGPKLKERLVGVL